MGLNYSMFKNIKQNKIIKEFKAESNRVRFILENQNSLPWEYLLTAELLDARIKDIKYKYDNLEAMVLGNKLISKNEYDFKCWAASICDDIPRIMQKISKIIVKELKKSWGPSGKPGDAIKIKILIDKIYMLCIKLIDIEIDIRSVDPPERFSSLRRSMEGITYPLINSIHRFTKEFKKNVNKLDDPNYKGEHTITLNWDLTSEINKIILELKMIKIRGDTNMQSIDNVSNIKSGSIDLIDLLTYARSNPEIPHKKNDSEIFKPFQELYLFLVNNVPKIPGWYAWINYNIPDIDRRLIYVGQSQTRNTSSLHDRLKEEFLDEYVAIWATEHDLNNVVDILVLKYQGKYDSDIRRSAEKAGSTHIVWLGDNVITDDQLNYVEHMLIKEFNPPANKRKPRYIKEYPELYYKVSQELMHEVSRI